MTTNKIIIIALIAFATGFFLATRVGCNGPANIVYVPEKSGSIKASDPVTHKPVIEYLPGKTVVSKQDSIDLAEAKIEIDRVVREYNLLDKDFANFNDSLKQAKYSHVIAPKSFSQPFEDSLVKGLINGIVFNGEVQNGTRFDYTVKKQEVDVPTKKLSFRFLLGGGAGVNKELNQGYYKFNGAVQDSRNRIYTGEFQKIGPVQYYGVGALFPIFTVNKRNKK